MLQKGVMNKIFLGIALISSICIFVLVISSNSEISYRMSSNIVIQPLIKQSENILDNCYHVYLDVGTNVGIQVSLRIYIFQEL